MSHAEATAILVAVSARFLAQAASLSGYRVHSLDLFADQDTRQLSETTTRLDYQASGFSATQLSNTLSQIIDRSGPMPVVFGSGFERCPQLLEVIAQKTDVLGCSISSVQQVCTPEVFFQALDELGISHPELSFQSQAMGEGWLVKRRGAFGGGHIRLYSGSDCGPTDYLQKKIVGQAGSVLILANGKQARVISCQETWTCSELSGSPFSYGGGITQRQLTEAQVSRLQRMADQLTRRFSLKGLCGLDFIIDEAAQIQLLEVNPRPPASLDLQADKPELFAWHIAACRDEQLPSYEFTQTDQVRAHQVLYATEDIRLSPLLCWPDWVSDIPGSGQYFRKGEPVCTIHAHAENGFKTKKILSHRAREMLSALGLQRKDWIA